MSNVDIGDRVLIVVEVGSRCGLDIEGVEDRAEDCFHLHVCENLARTILLTEGEGEVDTAVKNNTIFANGFSGR